ncbi:MAG TPA: RluA family pseudouridine synthase [Candidatus Saccharimonadales bacterium]|jgi:23S rRNA pseudouridine1911/1915/1917 synthase|nr:RluA family pseudouridine synthase [Candidatus Saccharimonadales bacterium]
MVKVSSMDVISVLRRFQIASEENVPRQVEQVKITNTTPLSTLVTFRFLRHIYYILFDDEALDDPEYVLQQIRLIDENVEGEVLPNPQDHRTEYALPFKGKEAYVFIAKSAKRRLDSELADRHPGTSRSTWQKHIKAGHISVNGEVQLSPKVSVTDSDSIAIDTPDATDYSDHELPIIYLDDNIIVINKPIGVLTHAKGALNDEFTVGEFFRRYSTYNADTNRPGIVHRLDRDTSGIMIGARNEATATMLQKQFADRKTKKTYIAITVGVPKNDAARIDLPIGRNPGAPSTFRVDVKGKSAITDYKVLHATDELAMLELRPYTGRTHQLRVHTRYMNTPILGDRVYGVVADRLYLHAKQLEITIPVGDRRIFEAPLPPEFEKHFPAES